MSNALDSITVVSEFAPLLPVAAAAYRWKKFSEAQRFFGVVLLLIFLNQMAAKAWYEILGKSNLPFYYVYFFIEAPGILFLYKRRFGSHRITKYLPWLALVMVLLTLINGLFVQGWFQLPSYTRTLEAVIMSLLSLFYFRFVFAERKVRHLDRSFWFWTSAGILLYFTSNLLMFMYTNWLLGMEDELFIAVWSIHAVSNFILYSFYAIGLLCQDQESSPSF